MAQFACDPTLKPGDTVLAARRAHAGEAFAWEPGGDADTYVRFVGPEYLALVDGQVYRRLMDGSLHPHSQLKTAHVVLRAVGGDPVYLTPHEFTTEWAIVDVPSVVLTVAGNEQVNDLMAELAAATDIIELLQAELAEARAATDSGSEVPPPSDVAGQADAGVQTPASAEPKRGPGRPPGVKNKPKEA